MRQENLRIIGSGIFLVAISKLDFEYLTEMEVE